MLSECDGGMYLVTRNDTTSTNKIIKAIYFHSSPETQHLTLSLNSSEFTDENQIQVRIMNLSNGKIYSDNWRLIHS